MKYVYYTKEIKTALDLSENEIFVFGSNLAGRHGAGAAKFAQNRLGAESGVGLGFTGRCFALPTKGRCIETLDLDHIQLNIELFISLAILFEDKHFFVTKVGCGLAGYKDFDIAPMFKGSPTNCIFHIDWKEYLE